MKKGIVFLGVLLMAIQYSYTQVNEEIEPYANFLRHEKTTAKEYILSLFKEKDIVILCERDHRELTQYDLILDVMKDPYFIDNVGVVYTEVGAFNLNPELNRFLQNSHLSEEEINQQVLKFQRNCMFPLWEKSTFAYFIKGIYEINLSLPNEKKIQHFPTDIWYVEGKPDSVKVRSMLINMANRDSIMAEQIITLFDRQQKEMPRKKALVIMNYRHAFKQDTPSPNGIVSKNVGRFLQDRYANKLANVMINNFKEMPGAVVQDGKWDAAIQNTHLEDVGFNFSESPFGNDNFDYWAGNTDLKYKNIFDGFVYYLPFEKWKIAKGLPGLMEDGFYEEYAQRVFWFNKAVGREIMPLQSKEEMQIYNNIHINDVEALDQMKEVIAKWLK
ncbi:MAG: hypothetical protein LBN27_11335 [Prevotellaceae bacterium]|jgi:hypothetical protein|nr:hypothetical protein [Prevotellaceae bacterium]